jgi:holo-[acyl-carrier protein] synthase
MKVTSVGIDLADIARFRIVLKSANSKFFANTFSKIEETYCRSHKDPAPHFAGTFAAKEAVRKTSDKFWIPFNELEIRRAISGKPEVWINGKKARSLVISITHTKTTAAAVALYSGI